MKKNKISENPLITVVTVVYQAENEIKRTLEAVKNQTYNNFEYIIIDGKSKDSTVDIILNYMPKFQKKNIDVVFSSEKDLGIYDAMNKAVLKSTGDWILFMNAGDTFYEDTILEQLETILKTEKCDVVHGNQCWNEPNNICIVESNNSEDLPHGQVLFHQSSLVRRDTLINNPFSLEYRIAGDYEFFLRLQQSGYSFHKINNVIANFFYGGISSTQPITCLKEMTKIRKKYNCIKQTKSKFIKYYLSQYIVAVVKTLLPRKIDLCIINWKQKVIIYLKSKL